MEGWGERRVEEILSRGLVLPRSLDGRAGGGVSSKSWLWEGGRKEEKVRREGEGKAGSG